MNNNILELVMIVKNSGELLRECLKHNYNYFDYWTICDTGSSDNTKEIIQEELKNKPGQLFEIDFFDFSQARTKALELASTNCKYIIVLDDSYVIENGVSLREFLSKHNNNFYNIMIGSDINGFLSKQYFSTRIIKTKIKNSIKYKYRCHEILNIKNKNEIGTIEDKHNKIFLNDKETREHQNRSVRRYNNDIKLLLQDLQDFSNDPRVLYYLGKTYYNQEKFEDSIKYFKLLSDVKDINKEYQFYSEYEQINCLIMLNKLNDEEHKNKLLKLQKKFPKRVEINYKLAILYNEFGEITKANKLISNILNNEKPNCDFTILEHDIYEYYIPYLYLDIKLRLGEYFNAIPVLQEMLKIYPENQPLLNMKYTILNEKLQISSIKLSENKTIVFHTGGEDCIFQHWNPNGDKRISGSEYMAMNLAKQFNLLGYRVLIFGSFEKNKEIDYQGFYDNIQYIDYKYFSEFALKYEIDYLVISRFTSNLIYYKNIKNVYLWVHDVLPVMNNSKCFQIHSEKFKKLITVSKWQTNYIQQHLKIPNEYFYISRNAIHPSRFLNKENFNKIPYRFIYSSDPSRGLNYLIDLIPLIKEKYPETTLQIFALKEMIDDNTLQKINSLSSYVFLSPRISQNELAIEFLKSDVWFYPTDFKETYCISSVEAMCAKCIVVTTKIGALTEIVEGKGILCDYAFDKNEMLKKLFFVLDKPELKNHLIQKAYNWAIQQTFNSLAKDWIKNLF